MIKYTVEKILIKIKLIANFKKNFKNINKEDNKENFYKANFVKVKKNIYYMYRKNALFTNK